MDRPILAMTVLAAGAGPAAGQSLNIDFGDEHGAPPPEHAAAARPGAWNVPTVDGAQTPCATAH
jgi:hypothetical protein